MKKEIDYLQLAKVARAEGNFKLVWICLKNQARMMRKMQKTPVTSRSQG